MKLKRVTLWGKESTMPGIPNANVPGHLYIEDTALVFRATWSNFTYSMPLEWIKETYVESQRGGGRAVASNLLTFGLYTADRLWVVLTYYSAEYDMDITLWFFIGNTYENPFTMRSNAYKLAKEIMAQRSQVLASIRKATVITYR